MKTRLLFVLVSLVVFGVSAFAQRSVTNADLERYRDQRVRAENDLRYNYARLGFPSPEELERREMERDRMRNELAARLHDQEVEEQRLIMQYRMAMAASRPQTIVIQSGEDYGDGFLQVGGYYGGYGSFGNGWNYRPRRGGAVQQQGYFGGGQFWPTGPRTFSAPIFQGGRRR